MRMDIGVSRGGRRGAPNPEYDSKAIVMNVTHADPQPGTHQSSGSSDPDRSSASTSQSSKRQHYRKIVRENKRLNTSRPPKLPLSPVKINFECIGGEGSRFSAATMFGAGHGESLARNGICEECILQTLSVTTLLAISMKASSSNIETRDRQEAGKGRGESVTGSHSWLWDGAWIRMQENSWGRSIPECTA